MRLFFQMLIEYQRLKHELRCAYIKFKAEIEIYVYEKKQEIYNRSWIKKPKRMRQHPF
jgi:hypothetical protein